MARRTNYMARHRAHARERALGRYGVVLTQFDYRWLCGQIEREDARNARLITRQPGARSIWLVRHEGRWMVAAYSSTDKCILTFLPLHAQFDDVTGLPLLTYTRDTHAKQPSEAPSRSAPQP